jgi:hypothetical protein
MNETSSKSASTAELQQAAAADASCSPCASASTSNAGIKLQQKGNQLVVNAQDVEACRYVQMLMDKGKTVKYSQ